MDEDNLQIKKGEEIPNHKADFKGENGNQIIIPGDIITIDPNEIHTLKVHENSDFMVIKVRI